MPFFLSATEVRLLVDNTSETMARFNCDEFHGADGNRETSTIQPGNPAPAASRDTFPSRCFVWGGHTTCQYQPVSG